MVQTIGCSGDGGGDPNNGGTEISSSSDAGANNNSSSSSECVGAYCNTPSSSSNGTMQSSSSAGGVSGGKGNDIVNYRTKQIGDQTWMAENLNYAVEGSKCHGIAFESGGRTYYDLVDENTEYCNKYGRLYDWATAMNLSSCNENYCAPQINTPHKGICPSGWHIPTRDEWQELKDFIESENECHNCAGKYLKSTSGWGDYKGVSGNGDDTYDFTALPGGEGTSSIGKGIGSQGYWWSSSEANNASISDYDARFAYLFDLSEIGYEAGTPDGDKSRFRSVRCIKN